MPGVLCYVVSSGVPIRRYSWGMARALITGATSGIGLEIAWQLAAERNDLVLVARNKARLEEVAEHIRQVADVRVDILPADLSTDLGIEAVCSRIRDTSDPINVLVNNAGFGLGQEFVGGSIERERVGLTVMVRAVMETCHAAAPVMAETGRGGILNVSSMTSLTAQGTYSAHKAWVRTFTEGLAASLEGTGVSVTAVCPGLVHTDFHISANVDPSQWPEYAFVSAEKVAIQAIDALRRGRVIITPSLRYRALAGMLRIAPRSLVRRVAGPGRSGRSAGIPE